MSRILTILTFFIGTITFTASAQSAADRAVITDTFGFGPRAGYYKAVDADEGNFYGGVQARLRLGAIVGLEGSVEYRGGQEYGFDDYTVKTRFIPVTASLLFFVPLIEGFAPYGIAGVGAYYTWYDVSDSIADLDFDDESSFNLGYHFGVGAELPLTSNVALNLDYRYLFLNPEDNQQSLEGANLNANVFTAGIMFYF